MKRLIFTIYDNYPVQEHRNKESDSGAIKAVDEYMDRLVENKRQYAELIGADFKFFYNTMPDESLSGTGVKFTDSNIYKHDIMSQMAEEYDQLMYVDMDVVFNTDLNIFNEIDLSKGIAVKDQDDQIRTKEISHTLTAQYGMRNPTIKYFITKDLLGGKENHVINTGVIIANSEHIKQIRFNERLPDVVKRINKLSQSKVTDDPLNKIRTSFYPNNEAIFSYLLEEYNIPYQLLDHEWHDIRSDEITDRSYGKVIHFINKQFHAFYNDKTKVVYSLYIHIENDQLDETRAYNGDTIPKSKRTQLSLAKYYDQLTENKRQYAKSIGAEFILYERDDDYENFCLKYKNEFTTEYDLVNLYKIYLMDQLADKYDYVLYLDFDVHCRKNIDIFNTLDCSHFMQCNYSDDAELNIMNEKSYVKNYKFDSRNPHSKYWNTHALLAEYGIEINPYVFNTGIMAASKHIIKKLDFFDDLSDILYLMTELKNDEFSMYPDNIRESFGYDNETIFSFKIFENNVNHSNLNKRWHYKHYAKMSDTVRMYEDTDNVKKIKKELFDAIVAKDDPVFIHFISKQIELAYC